VNGGSRLDTIACEYFSSIYLFHLLSQIPSNPLKYPATHSQILFNMIKMRRMRWHIPPFIPIISLQTSVKGARKLEVPHLQEKEEILLLKAQLQCDLHEQFHRPIWIEARLEPQV